MSLVLRYNKQIKIAEKLFLGHPKSCDELLINTITLLIPRLNTYSAFISFFSNSLTVASIHPIICG